MIKGRGTRSTVGERRNRSVRNARIRVELTIRPAESNALLASPYVGGVVRVGGLYIRPGGDYREVHLGATSLSVQRRSQLAASSAFLTLLISQAGLLTLSSVRPLEVQVLRSQQLTAALRRLTHHRAGILAVLVAVVTPNLHYVLLRRIQSIRRNLHDAAYLAVLELRKMAVVVILKNVARRQNRGVRALLTNHILNTPGEVKLAVEAGTQEVNVLISGSITQSLVLHLGSKRAGSERLSVQRTMKQHVLASPQIIKGQRGLTLFLGKHANLIIHLVTLLVTRSTGEGGTRLIVVLQLTGLNRQLSIQGAVFSNGEVLTLLKTEQHILSGQEITIVRNTPRSSNVKHYFAVLLAPLLGVAPTLHMNGAALSGVQVRILAVVPIPERNLLRGLTRNISSRHAVAAFEVQLLGSKQGAAVLGCLTYDGGNKLAVLIALVTPHLDNIIF